eukprot:Phypoly_transcript_01906.p1 GENE.Phypoly_transcript_01906~~Phypoly_transcript_01906.p1  ORF type:complete len:952 (+),score=135.50 Phypoly_transcript_01906:167-3022(+)
MQTRTVIVIGGGFAGWSTINNLQQLSPKRTQLILIDNKEYFENTPGLPHFLVHRTREHDSSEIHFPHSAHLSLSSQFVCGDVTEITHDAVVVRNMKSKGKEMSRIRFDCLVICSGRRYRPIDLDDRTLSTRAKFINAQRDLVHKAETLLVVGGGPSGVELAAALAYQHADKSVTLMHKGNALISRTSESASAYVDAALRSLKVHIVYKKESNLANRRSTASLPVQTPHIYDKVFGCIGGNPSTRFMQDHFASHLDSHGAIMVNRFFQLAGYPNIFAIGDVTNLQEEKTAERAMVHGELVAQHIKSFLKRKSMGEKGYVAKQDPFMQVISLGPENGIALLSGNQVTVGPVVSKMKYEFVKTTHAALVSKLVTNKRFSLYGLMPKTAPPPPPPPPKIEEIEEEVVDSPRNKFEMHRHRKILCCFTGAKPATPEPELIINQDSPRDLPRISPRGDQATLKRRQLRSMCSAVGLLDVTDLPDVALGNLNPRALVLGADNAIAKLLIEALAHTGMRTRAAVSMHTWISHSASYKLSYSMLIHNVECVDYNTNEEQSLDTLLEGIQVLLLPIGLNDPAQLTIVLGKMANRKDLRCVIYVRLISAEDIASPSSSRDEIEEMLRAYKLPHVVVRHSVTMQTVRDVIGRQVHCFRSIVWPENATSKYMLDQKDLCSALVMMFHEPRRYVGKVYHFAGPELLSGADLAKFLSEMVGDDISYIEASKERVADFLLWQGYTEAEANRMLQKICAPPLPSRPTDLDLILDMKPSSFSKWLTNNIHSFSDVWASMSSSGPPRRLSRKSSRPRSAQIRKSETPVLLEVLMDKMLSRKFFEFLQAEASSENYLFWHSVERFKEIEDTDEMIACAIEISNQYIYEGGPSPIEIDQKLRVTILSNMRMGLSKDIFDVAQDRVLRLMEMEAYPRFAKAAGLLAKNGKGLLRARSAGSVESSSSSSSRPNL